MEYQKITMLQDVFFHSQNISFWNITKDMELLYSNCPEQSFFTTCF